MPSAAAPPPETLPFSPMESDRERRAADLYEDNVFLTHVTEGAVGAFNRVDGLVDEFIAKAVKDYEAALRESAAKIKEEVKKSVLSLNAQQEVATWNVRRLAPLTPAMPAPLVALASQSRATSTPSRTDRVVLDFDDDIEDPDHSGDEALQNDEDWEDESVADAAE